MIKTHKITLRPDRDQIAWFYQQCGYVKFAYNSAASDFRTELSAGKFLSKIGIPIVQADRFFASSKMCSTCGHKKDTLTLSDRDYHCCHCGTSIDRDVNAAINLKHVAVGYTET